MDITLGRTAKRPYFGDAFESFKDSADVVFSLDSGDELAIHSAYHCGHAKLFGAAKACRCWQTPLTFARLPKGERIILAAVLLSS